MSENVTFRSASEVASNRSESAPVHEPQNPDRPTGGDIDKEVDSPILLYMEIKGYPYTADYFDVKGIWDKPDIGIQSDIELIEKAYKDRVEEGIYEDGKDTFDIFIKEAELATNCEHSPRDVKIAKIAQWVKFMWSIKNIEKGKLKDDNTD